MKLWMYGQMHIPELRLEKAQKKSLFKNLIFFSFVKPILFYCTFIQILNKKKRVVFIIIMSHVLYRVLVFLRQLLGCNPG